MAVSEKTEIDLTKTAPDKALEHEAQLMKCRFSPCGKYVFASSYDSTVVRWELESGKATVLAGAHGGWVDGLAFHPDGKHLYSADTWGKVCCWTYADAQPKPKWSIDAAHPSWIRSVVVSPDGKQIATAGNDLVVRTWSASDGKPIGEFKGHQRHIYSLAYHPDGKHLVSGDLVGVVKQWDLTSGKHVRDFDASQLVHRAGDRVYEAGAVFDIKISPDGKHLVCSGIEKMYGMTVAGQPLALSFDWATGKRVTELRVKDFKGTKRIQGLIVMGLHFHPEGFLIGVGGNGERDGAMWFWQVDKSEPVFEIDKIPGSRNIDIHPDGERFAVAQFKANGRGINGGNGLHSKIETYHRHHGVIQIYALKRKPTKAEKEKKDLDGLLDAPTKTKS